MSWKVMDLTTFEWRTTIFNFEDNSVCERGRAEDADGDEESGKGQATRRDAGLWPKFKSVFSFEDNSVREGGRAEDGTPSAAATTSREVRPSPIDRPKRPCSRGQCSLCRCWRRRRRCRTSREACMRVSLGPLKWLCEGASLMDFIATPFC